MSVIEFDLEVGPSGLYYYRHRYYDAKLGRFLAQDPSGFASGDVNLYRYAENNPVQLTDPYGLQATGRLGLLVADSIGTGLDALHNGVGDIVRGLGHAYDAIDAFAYSASEVSALYRQFDARLAKPGIIVASRGVDGLVNYQIPETVMRCAVCHGSADGTFVNLAAFPQLAMPDVQQEALKYFSNQPSRVSIYTMPDMSIGGAVADWMQEHPRVLGGVQMVGATAEIASGASLFAAGVATGWTGVGVAAAVGGGAVFAHGLDVFAAGAQTVWTGEGHRTQTSQTLDYVTGDPRISELVDMGISVGGAAGSALGNVKLASRTQVTPQLISSRIIAETEGVYGWDATHPFIEGTVDVPRSAAHRFLQMATAEEARASGAYSRIAMNTPLSEFFELPHSPNIRADVMGLTTEGRIDLIEIMSKWDKRPRLEGKLIKALEQLQPEMRGGFTVIDPTDALK